MARKQAKKETAHSRNFTAEDYELLLEMRRNEQRLMSECRDELLEFHEFNFRERELIKSICSPESKSTRVMDNYLSYNAYRALKRVKYYYKSLTGQELRRHE